MSNHEDTPSNPSTQNRRSSFTSQTFNSIFGRSNSTAGGPTAPFPGAISTAAAQDQRRRMSISTLGLSGNSPTQATPFAFGGRRGSTSTDRSDLFDENAIDDDDSPGRGIPTGPFARRMSVGGQAFRARAASTSPGAAGEGGGFNWSEQLRSRAESTVSQSQRPSFSASTGAPKTTPMHERTRSLGEMPTPPVSGPAPAPAPAPERPARKKPDAFQERILKGDFYMD